ncbi:hypothetical protein E2C01_032220 [Portunus trituberculatus]|uniref:Uncharacterized protein n=1 Tax=Portunus trituberculatus TaxID=210409 RepID=A0A5B7F0B8_PORTR|nr:hypothetical protein [Portunus trituberculatus]
MVDGGDVELLVILWRSIKGGFDRRLDSISEVFKCFKVQKRTVDEKLFEE